MGCNHNPFWSNNCGQSKVLDVDIDADVRIDGDTRITYPSQTQASDFVENKQLILVYSHLFPIYRSN